MKSRDLTLPVSEGPEQALDEGFLRVSVIVDGSNLKHKTPRGGLQL
jgi:hypothetical protein